MSEAKTAPSPATHTEEKKSAAANRTLTKTVLTVTRRHSPWGSLDGHHETITHEPGNNRTAEAVVNVLEELSRAFPQTKRRTKDPSRPAPNSSPKPAPDPKSG